jgi:hypothetical protein
MLATADLARKANVRAAWSYYEELPLCRLTPPYGKTSSSKKPRQELSACSIVKTKTRIYMLKWILKVSFLAVSFSLLVSELSYSQGIAFTSWNFPDRYIRHRNWLCYIEPIGVGDKVGQKDATFRRVPGLAGKGSSFESVNFPGHFLRHQNFRLKLAKFVDEKLFREDATFYFVKGLANQNGRSFESFNFPKHYIRHRDFELMISPYDGSDLFKKDATFKQVQPPRGQIIDHGTELHPVEE